MQRSTVETYWVKNSTQRVAETWLEVGLKMICPKLLLDDKSCVILKDQACCCKNIMQYWYSLWINKLCQCTRAYEALKCGSLSFFSQICIIVAISVSSDMPDYLELHWICHPIKA